MDAPPVLLIHGFASSADHGWRKPGWIDLLTSAGRESLAVDLLGHGGAARYTDPSAYAEVEQEVNKAISHLPLLDVVAFSAGADIALRLAVSDPSRFRRLALLGVGPFVFSELHSEKLAAFLESPPDPTDTSQWIFRRMAENNGNDPLALAAFLRRPRRPLSVAELAGLTNPVLIVIGERDHVGPADAVRDALPGATLLTLPGMDHFGTPSDVRCMQAVMRFLGD